MNSRERVLAAINHREADRIPFDLGGMAQSGIHHLAYRSLREYLGFPEVKIRLLNQITQAAQIDDDLIERLGIDTRVAYGYWADPRAVSVQQEGKYLVYVDEWGFEWRILKDSGYNYVISDQPFGVEAEGIDKVWQKYSWPDPLDPARFEGLREKAKHAREQGKFVVLMGLCPGIVEIYAWLRGYEQFYLDLGAEPKVVHRFLDKISELKIAYWEQALSEVGEYVDAINEADDVASQANLLWSPETYRNLIKPYHQKIFDAIKSKAPGVKILFHSCGAVRSLIPDLIEIGIDILHPVQPNAKGMDPFALKKDFGRDICFWGCGFDVQDVLSTGPTQRIRDHVKRSIEALAPDGGYIISPTTIIGPNIPPENFMVAWETLQKYGAYV